MIQCKNYINGQFIGSRGGTLERRNPANTQEVVGVINQSGEDEINNAVSVAHNAFPAWRAISRVRRGEYLDRLVQVLKRETESFSRLVAREMGKNINEATAEVTEGIHMVQYVVGTARTPFGDVVSSEIAEKDSFMRRKPKGVVAAITPWNFPFAIPFWLIAPSVAEGNTVVFKPSKETSCTAQKLAECVHEVGFPPGVINFIYGSGEKCGMPLVRHPDIPVVLFTGSAEIGQQIRKVCAEFPDKMCACEMGGKNAIIVLDDADMNLAVNASVISAYKTSGQRCTAASRIIVHKNRLKEFEKKFVEMSKRIRIGDPLDQNMFTGPLINETQMNKVLNYNQLAKDEGARVLLDGARLTQGKLANGYFLSPFVYRMTHNTKSRVLREEVFGPHVAIIPVKDLEQAIEIHNDTDYGLVCSVITEDFRKAREVRERCDYGLGYWNLPTIGAEVHLPFGGVKKSGTGMPSASTLIDVVTHRTAWTVNYSKEIKMAQGMRVDIK
ncbi:MAG: aldehyde dehydrogenase [Planctomycetes bacterium RIFCSPHIGHO2_02_FULL_50_42]|nr:MAG: aldehyde dehydrogenase [Planctomycetes bacterium GWA2_50_13]OHB90590.1 MAG: aldehyde dehydrogenase [Planctomycetes bacterium RIFCSPHIGHO2_02_FULL_50_42]OHB94707.1 MAG: aldehyde dehydrogenase [Planctomycetes bacterium RIFCSPLOWO2_02_FULL_50_16]OHC04095.1 MAG: aldehyde dehydrogenase [Planctomycetes bacterium RIFCSPLOWO2_12_FULL_50_35]